MKGYLRAYAYVLIHSRLHRFYTRLLTWLMVIPLDTRKPTAQMVDMYTTRCSENKHNVTSS